MCLAGNGAGGGGRVAVFLSENYAFHGELQAHGGDGSAYGPPGTVYLQYDNDVSVHRELRVDNLNRGSTESCDYATILNETDTDYDFVKLDLRRKACLQIVQVSSL